MTVRFKTSCAIGALMMMAACTPAPPPPPPAPPDTRAADEKTIRDSETTWSQEMAAKDVDKVIAHYADNATLMASGMASMTSKDAMRAAFKQMFVDMGGSLSFTTSTVEVAKSGDIAYSQGTYTMTMPDPKTKKTTTEKGSYVTVYKKQADGSWKAVEDINTPGAPDTPPAAPNKK